MPSEGQGASSEATPGVSWEAGGRHSDQATSVTWRGLAAQHLTVQGAQQTELHFRCGGATSAGGFIPMSLALKASRVPVVEARPLGGPTAEQGLVMRKAG